MKLESKSAYREPVSNMDKTLEFHSAFELCGYKTEAQLMQVKEKLRPEPDSQFQETDMHFPLSYHRGYKYIF